MKIPDFSGFFQFFSRFFQIPSLFLIVFLFFLINFSIFSHFPHNSSTLHTADPFPFFPSHPLPSTHSLVALSLSRRLRLSPVGCSEFTCPVDFAIEKKSRNRGNQQFFSGFFWKSKGFLLIFHSFTKNWKHIIFF